MANVSVYNMAGQEIDKIELSDAVFGVEVNEHLVHLAVVQQNADNRQGTQKAKTRSEVSGGGKKPYRHRIVRRAPAMRARVRRGLRSSPAAVLYLHRFRVIIPSR